MKKIWMLFLGLFFVSLFAEEAPPANSHLLREGTIPEFKLEQATLTQAIDALRENTKQGEVEVNFVLPPETKADERNVSLDLRGVSGLDALSMILQQSKTRAEIRLNSIWILPNP